MQSKYKNGKRQSVLERN